MENAENFTLISLYNYSGNAVKFDESMYFNTANGVVYALADQSECTCDEFVSRKKKIVDKLQKTPHSRQTVLRNLYFEYEGKSIETRYDIECCGIEYYLSDGKLHRDTYYYDTENKECDAQILRRKVNE